jgi:hypothetical protein
MAARANQVELKGQSTTFPKSQPVDMRVCNRSATAIADGLKPLLAERPPVRQTRHSPAGAPALTATMAARNVLPPST